MRHGRVVIEHSHLYRSVLTNRCSRLPTFAQCVEELLCGLSVTIWVPVPKPASGASAADDVSPIFRLRHAKSGVDAQAQQIDGEFTMLAGSSVVPSWHGVGKAASTRKAYMSYRTQHEQLLANGSIVVDGDRGRLTRNVVFPAPSTAGAVALGRSCNGRREWIASEGTTFGDWESRGVE